MPSPDKALPGRDAALVVNPVHAVLEARPLDLGKAWTTSWWVWSFWGAERKFWTLPDVVSTVSYAADHAEPTYEECVRTGHNRWFGLSTTPTNRYRTCSLCLKPQSHQGVRQGNDMGAIPKRRVFLKRGAKRAAESTKATFQEGLRAAAVRSRQILPAGPFFYAEDYHKRYLHRTGGYCGLGRTGVSCPT